MIILERLWPELTGGFVGMVIIYAASGNVSLAVTSYLGALAIAVTLRYLYGVL